MSLALEKTELARHVSVWQIQGKLFRVEGQHCRLGLTMWAAVQGGGSSTAACGGG